MARTRRSALFNWRRFANRLFWATLVVWFTYNPFYSFYNYMLPSGFNDPTLLWVGRGTLEVLFVAFIALLLACSWVYLVVKTWKGLPWYGLVAIIALLGLVAAMAFQAVSVSTTTIQVAVLIGLSILLGFGISSRLLDRQLSGVVAVDGVDDHDEGL